MIEEIKHTASKKVTNGWAMYDWANSVYSLVITTTFFPAYYAYISSVEKYPDGISFLGKNFINTALKDYTLAAALLVVAILSPVLSSIADYKGNKKNFMRFFCYMGALSCSLMFFVDEKNILFGLFCLMMACIGFFGSQVFYNSYLPEIAAEKDMDRISARGFSFGYIGSVLMQLIGFGLVLAMPDNPIALKLTFLMVGFWWAGFAQITFNTLPAQPVSDRKKKINVFSNGFKELAKVWQTLREMNILKSFLSAYFFYSMGVQTVMLVAIDFAIKILHLPDTNLIIVAVIIQLVAIGGAIIMSRLSGKFGNVQVLLSSVFVWIVICVAAYFIKTKIEFYILAALVGFVMGGIQSLSRSTYSKLMPETKDTASFFSFYDVTEKIALVIGLFAFGFIEDFTKSMRNSILILILFFIIGAVFLFLTLSRIRKQKSI
jgi:UMF1 family MFS transporter